MTGACHHGKNQQSHDKEIIAQETRGEEACHPWINASLFLFGIYDADFPNNAQSQENRLKMIVTFRGQP